MTATAVVDTSGWSGEGDFTAALVRAIAELPDIEHARVEDSPASRAESGYAFLSNEIYVRFVERAEAEPYRWLGFVPRVRRRLVPRSTLHDLERQLAGHEEIGPAEYVDEGMIQYLKAERIIPPYQTRGYKVVEMVRVYQIRAAAGAVRS
jgi:hypothetical protein